MGSICVRIEAGCNHRVDAECDCVPGYIAQNYEQYAIDAGDEKARLLIDVLELQTCISIILGCRGVTNGQNSFLLLI